MSEISQHPDAAAVDAFAHAMKVKLAVARAKGRGGWQDKDECSAQMLSDMLRAHVEKGDPRDVANFCMFLHHRGEAIQPAPARQEAVVAWMTKGGRVINAETRERVLANAELGGEFVPAAKAAESYCIPLHHPAAQGVGVPAGWKPMPIELAPEMAAAAAAAVWPVASQADLAKAREAALILLKTSMAAMPGATLESIAAGIATMFPAYRAFVAAATTGGVGTRCAGCDEVIRPSVLTGTTCACANQTTRNEAGEG